MSDQPQTEHDNSWLKIYLKVIAAAGAEGMSKSESDDKFQTAFEEAGVEGEFPGAAKIRQTCYIAKLAKGKGDLIWLTQEGVEYISGE